MQMKDADAVCLICEMPLTELESKIASLRQSLQSCDDADSSERAVKQLDGLCRFMAEKQLPEAARLFILNNGILSLTDMECKNHEVIQAAEGATMLGFSIQGLKEFIECCSEGSNAYDYILTQTATGAGASTSIESPQPPQPPQPRRRQSLIENNSVGSPSASHSMDEWRRVSTDTGYSSGIPVGLNVGPQPPIPKPRRGSGNVATLPEGVAAGVSRGHRTSDPGLQQRPLIRSGGGSCVGRFFQLLAFPEKAVLKKQPHSSRRQSTT